MSYYKKSKIIITDHAYTRALERLNLKEGLTKTEYDIKIRLIAEKTLNEFNVFEKSDTGEKLFLIQKKYWKFNKPVCMISDKNEKIIITFKFIKNGY